MTDVFSRIHDGSEYKVFQNGEWVRSAAGATLEVKSPIDGAVLGSLQAMSQSEVDETIVAARAAQLGWDKATLTERTQILRKRLT